MGKHYLMVLVFRHLLLNYQLRAICFLKRELKQMRTNLKFDMR
jgi:hypothetical protein